jgi:hypothetical protein
MVAPVPDGCVAHSTEQSLAASGGAAPPAGAFWHTQYGGSHAQPDVADFGRFAAATAEHFRGRVDRYGIWNEPNYIAWLKPLNRAPALYRKLYLAGYKAIKANDGAAKVLIGETVPTPRVAEPWRRSSSCARWPASTTSTAASSAARS